jgi:hypothetical protein
MAGLCPGHLRSPCPRHGAHADQIALAAMFTINASSAVSNTRI